MAWACALPRISDAPSDSDGVQNFFMTQKTQSIHAEAGLHRKLVLFAVQLEIYLAHFPNCHKYTLTQGIRQAYLDVYNLVTECQKRYHKKTTLTLLDVRHEQLRIPHQVLYSDVFLSP